MPDDTKDFQPLTPADEHGDRVRRLVEHRQDLLVRISTMLQRMRHAEKSFTKMLVDKRDCETIEAVQLLLLRKK